MAAHPEQLRSRGPHDEHVEREVDHLGEELQRCEQQALAVRSGLPGHAMGGGVLARTAAGELHRGPTDERENSPPSTTARGRGGHSPPPLPKRPPRAAKKLYLANVFTLAI